jgi:hypothetical protein
LTRFAAAGIMKAVMQRSSAIMMMSMMMTASPGPDVLRM